MDREGVAKSVSGVLDILLVARHAFGGHPPLGDWQMARALSERHRVLFVNPPVRPRRSLSGSLRPQAEHVGPRLTVVTPVGLPGANRRTLAWANDPLFVTQVRRVARRVFAGRLPVVLTFDPRRGSLRGLPRELSVYWRRDRLADLSVAPNRAMLRARDRQLLKRSDLVVCTARTLMSDAEALTSAPVRHIPNGCEAAHFMRPQVKPPRLERDASATLGFVGGAFWRLDLDLLRTVALRRPDWHLVLVGDACPPLADLANVTCVTYVPYEQVPAWMQHLDVGLIPYDMKLPFNEGSFPIKAFEYLAAGVPVVSTEMPALKDYEPWIRRARSPEGFLDRIEDALSEGPDAGSCRTLAEENTWQDRAHRLEDHIKARIQETRAAL